MSQREGPEYEDTGAYEQAVDGMADPLRDPLPRRVPRRSKPAAGQAPGQGPGGPQQSRPTSAGSPWFRPHVPAEPGDSVFAPEPLPQQQAQEPVYAEPEPASVEPPYVELEPEVPRVSWGAEARAVGPTVYAEGVGDVGETAMLPVIDEDSLPLPVDDETVALRVDKVRASRSAGEGSRMAARKAARAVRQNRALIASRLLGEAFITFGVLMLLFVVYQLWWTNVLADRQAGNEARKLEKQWEQGGGEQQAGAFEPGKGFAIMHIPKLDVKTPIASGISKNKVLDKGMVGHYAEGDLKTALPWDKEGNFAVAGHRNTHGEPFRYVNKLEPGDEIIVETKSTYYIYEMASMLPSTSPSNIGVIDKIPKGSGFDEPGRYVTLTTCTPEFTSKYRLIVWGKMVDAHPRSKGLPKALAD